MAVNETKDGFMIILKCQGIIFQFLDPASLAFHSELTVYLNIVQLQLCRLDPVDVWERICDSRDNLFPMLEKCHTSC